jgi:hypothetical protein
MPITARNVGKTILLTIVTLGIYSFIWVYRTHEELKTSNGEGLGGAIGLILYIFTGVATWFLVPMEIEKAYAKVGRPSPVKTMDGLWVLLPIIGAFIWYPKVQKALNELSSDPVPA